MTCPPWFGPRYVHTFQADSRWGDGLMVRVRTDCKLRGNNWLFRGEKGFRADVVDAGSPLCSWRGFRGRTGGRSPPGIDHLSSFVNFAPFKEMSAIRPFVSKTNPTTGSRTVVGLRSPPVRTSITATSALTPPP